MARYPRFSETPTTSEGLADIFHFCCAMHQNSLKFDIIQDFRCYELSEWEYIGGLSSIKNRHWPPEAEVGPTAPNSPFRRRPKTRESLGWVRGFAKNVLYKSKWRCNYIQKMVED